MLSPSDFNNAVPQFTNGNYASNPINPQYIAEPDAESYNRGTEPLQTLPAQWWNWFVNKFTARFNKVNIYVKNIFNELAQVLSIFNITPDGTEQTPTTSQLKTVFECCYPQYVKNDLYGNIAGTALGTAAVGTATTFARSDHVHPIPSMIQNDIYCACVYANTLNITSYNGESWINWTGSSACTKIGNGAGDGGYGTLIANTFCGTLCGNAHTASYAVQATGPIPFDAAEQAHPLGACVRAVVTKGITEGVGYRSRMAIGLMYCGAWAHGLISVGCNDEGTGWDNFIFPAGHGGTVVTTSTIGCYNAGSASRAAGLTLEPNLWTAYSGVWYCGEKVAYTNFCNPTDNYILAIYTPYKYPDKFYYCGSGVLLIPPHGLIEPPDGLSVTETGGGIRLF